MNISFLKAVKGFVFGLFLTAGLFILSPTVFAGELNFHALYVGNGDCLIIESNGHYMMVDSGYDTTLDKVIKYLDDLNIPENKIDYAVATHPDADHVGGFAGIFDQFDVGEVIYSPCTKTSDSFNSFIASVKEHEIPYRTPTEGETLVLGDATVEVIYDGYQGTTYNECSIILRITCDEKSILLMADLPTITANSLMKQGYVFKGDILKLGHHGASSSTSAEFLDEVNPSYAVISASEMPGVEPAYPRDAVLKKLARRFIKTYRTVDGNICITIKDGVISTDNKEHNDFVSITQGTLTLDKDVMYSTGEQLRPKVTLKVDEAVIPANQYNVKYTSNKYTGTATVKVTGSEEKYIGSLKTTFKILPGKVTLTPKLEKLNKIALKWKAQKNVSGYTIVYTTDENFQTGLKYVNIKNATKITKTLRDLPYKTTYYFKIRAYRSNFGYGKWGKIKSVTTADPYPAKKKIKKILPVEDNSVVLKWKLSDDDQAKGYIIQYSTDESFSKKTKKVKIKKHTKSNITISKLKPNKTYYYRLRGYNKYGKGEWSEVLSYQLLEDTENNEEE